MKILLLGDSPYITTGFGRVNARALAILSNFHEVYILGGQDTEERGSHFFPTTDIDPMGWSQVERVYSEVQPDAIHVIADPATVMAWLLQKDVFQTPTFAYMPVEGAPLNGYWTQMFTDPRNKNVNYYTTSQFGVDTLRGAGIDSRLIYHGVSDEFTYRDDRELRDKQRHAVGWEPDWFVVMSVAQNVERKQWPRLLEAMKYVRKSDPSVYLYAHTTPWDMGRLGGHDLIQLASQIGVSDRVIFNERLADRNHGVPIVGSDQPGLVDLYNMADAFALFSEVEGFGIPLVEAMKCGLPVATTGYAAGAEVVGDAGITVEPFEYVWNKTHARYAHVDPKDIAKAILKMRNPEVRKKMISRGLERGEIFTWDEYDKQLLEFFSDARIQAQKVDPSPAGQETIT